MTLDPRQRAHGDRRLPLDADLRLHAADHRLHRRPAAVRRRAAPAVLAHDRRACSASCATSANRSCGSSAAFSPRVRRPRLQPDARDHRAVRSSTASSSRASSTAEHASMRSSTRQLDQRGAPARTPTGRVAHSWRRWLLAALVMVCVVVIDQLSKHRGRNSIIPGEERRFLPGVAAREHAQPRRRLRLSARQPRRP